MMASMRAASPPGRISQLLPTVKCSSCGVPVPLPQLGDHVCTPPPPVPALPKPAVTPTQATALLPQRLQNLLTPTVSRINTSFNSEPSSARASPSSAVDAPPAAPFMARARSASNSSSPSTARPFIPPPDTRVGGEGGMAGVGRRAFQAAAMQQRSNPPPPPPDVERGAPPSKPQQDSPSAAALPRALRIGGTPTQQVRGPSPARRPSPAQPIRNPSPARRPSPARTPPRRLSPVRRAPSPADSESDYGGLAYADSDEDDLRSKASTPPSLPLSSLLRSKSSSREGRVKFGDLSHKKSSSSISSVDTDRSNSSAIAQALGLSQTPPQGYATIGGPGLPMSPRSVRSASGSSSSGRSAYSRTSSSAPRTGRLDKAMETLLENNNTRPSLSKSKSTGNHGEALSVASGARTQRSNTVQVTTSPENKPVKLPTRARSEKDRSPETDRKTRRAKVCARCETRIEDGRWIQVDGGKTLCVRCWKNMYLPKCRRCNLPIEKQAVSSSDGQLKGKYHKECFNCHICHKPFPDKSFYIFDGKPLCAYHYHEQNNSLCSSASCGQPIEGPCAVSHTGDRYHPEHLLCEFSGYPRCRERLEDYFEVDGKMLCERHARMSRSIDDDHWVESTRAMKRKTRFMNLAGAGIDEMT